MFFAEHNVAVQVVDHLVPLLKKIAPDPDIIQKCKLGRTKCSKIIENVLAEEQKGKLVKKLQKCKFSVLIDESTDISCNKTMCVITQFYDEVMGKVNIQLLDLLQVGSDGSAESLYKDFKELISGYKIPLSNIIGLRTDGENLMVGKTNSFSYRLLIDNPDTITIKCLCHYAAIVANKAYMTLPRAPEELIRQIGTYMSGSAKRCSELREFQDLLNEEKRRILKVSETRWLSRQKCVERILSNWNVLLEYFKFASQRDKLKSAEAIYNDLTNECNKAYLLFLKYVLNSFNCLNALFQSKKTLIYIVHSESMKIFLKLGQNCIKKSELKIDCVVRSPHISVQIEDVFLGLECEEFLKDIPENTVKKIKTDCLQFYLTALEEIQKRLPLKEDSIFKEMEFLNPMAAFSENGKKFKFDLLCSKYKISINDTIQEFITLEYNFTQNEIKEFEAMDIVEFWTKIIKLKDINGNCMFPNLSKLATAILTIVLLWPHANAERILPTVTEVPTKKRNKCLVALRVRNPHCKMSSKTLHTISLFPSITLENCKPTVTKFPSPLEALAVGLTLRYYVNILECHSQITK
ncbi:uncharacterized protein LOC142231254 [Haematobia irritans]|uniref:uncharacterized protein LOC142231254 n=1 Tax=Haematobia irritans TaxID=7368 RepID=UPI003F4FB389